MTPEEKAQELVDKFIEHFYGFGIDMDTRQKEAKQCALIAVDEILGIDSKQFLLSIGATNYWQQVKEAILKL